MSCFPDARPTRRERFRRWSERERNRWWRRFHPQQAARYDAEQRAMWEKIGPPLKAVPDQGFDWYMDTCKFPPLTLRQRAVNAFWRVVEALP